MLTVKEVMDVLSQCPPDSKLILRLGTGYHCSFPSVIDTSIVSVQQVINGTREEMVQLKACIYQPYICEEV